MAPLAALLLVRLRRVRGSALALAAWLCLASGAVAQAAQAAHVAPDSPRAAMERFIELGRAGHFDQAADFLQLPPGTPPADATRLARRLKFVLDRYVWLDWSQLSGESEGRLDDGLTPETEEIGRIPRKSGADEPVRLVRVQTSDGLRWVFSAATVEHVDSWFATLRDRWILEHLPDALLKPGPLDLAWWQWLALPVFVLVGWFLGFFFARLTRAILGRLVARTKATWDDAVLAKIGGPLTAAWLVVVLHALLPLLGLAAPDEHIARQVLHGAFFAVVFWALMRSVDVFVQVVQQSQWTISHPAAYSLMPLAGRVIKIVVFVLAVVAALSAFGFPVGSLIAGLGIGGLALALAAQKTVENLVGAFSIGVDQPFKEGDFVKVGDHSGYVEDIGLRSTRLRTLDRTLVTIPNAQISEQRVECFAPRDRIRLAMTIGIEYGATRAQLLQVIQGFEAVMRGHPKIWPDNVVSRFTNLGESALEVEILCWFQTADFNEYRDMRQEVLLGFMDVVEKAKCGFAFPTRTVHLFEQAREAKTGPR